MGDVTTPQDPARDQVEGTAGAPPTTSRRRGRWWHLAGGVVALLLVAWIGIGLNPRFADGYVAQLGAPLVEVEDPSGAPDAPPWGTYEVTDPPGDEAEFMVSVRNTG
ncbi:hypothetical protein [Actinotalea ferrariae]|uniref:hypothetical protein n=1 Tax=Actinotalea ferrariae TaxID=1386098 RepID=UPI0012DCCAF8|nr:hypothetical protein [Actinotalea ferrariae]